MSIRRITARRITNSLLSRNSFTGNFFGGPSRLVVNATDTWLAPVGVSQISYLVVGGGGSGGFSYSGGGGAGGVRTGVQGVVPGTTYTLTIGAGAPGRPTFQPGASGFTGSNSSITAPGFSAIIGSGGGAAGASPSPGTQAGGGAGGSGGGGIQRNNTPATGGAGNIGGFTPAEGFDGGPSQAPGGGGGGGGGAGGAGLTGLSGVPFTAGNGGIGIFSSLSGANIGYAGGGGGADGGMGGGGGNNGSFGSANSGSLTYSPSVRTTEDALPNRGGGGGGGSERGNPNPINQAGGNGGSGVIILVW